MALTRDEFSRRLFAARILRGEGFDGHGQPAGYDRDKLGAAVAAEKGQGHSDPAKIEQRSKDAALAHIRAFERELQMPPGWFTEPDLDKVLGDHQGLVRVSALVERGELEERARAEFEEAFARPSPTPRQASRRPSQRKRGGASG